ncbi:hypothetical protein CEXT_293371 [Caerostris extrusa]|uniref:Uncharacterized protein n=1 Tax=Caerostris extrusa TaxID=172846 RepID=A0AAV4TF63_CAEEX|nr:hypothetical protein CEXT_293371 [Caerostris extrusa]
MRCRQENVKNGCEEILHLPNNDSSEIYLCKMPEIDKNSKHITCKAPSEIGASGALHLAFDVPVESWAHPKGPTGLGCASGPQMPFRCPSGPQVHFLCPSKPGVHIRRLLRFRLHFK